MVRFKKSDWNFEPFVQGAPCCGIVINNLKAMVIMDKAVYEDK